MANAVDIAVRIVTKLDDSGLNQAQGKFGKFNAGLSKAAGVATVALGAMAIAGGHAAQAAAEDQQAQVLLANSMRNAAGATSSQVAATEAWITAQSQATGIADDELRPALGALVRATGDVEQSQKALAVAMDVSAATGKPLETVSAALAKGFGGTTSSLSRLVPGLDKAAVASGDMDKILAALSKTTKGAAAEAADSAAGRYKNFQTQLGEVEESIGAGLLPVMSSLTGVLQDAAVWAQNNAKAFQVIIGVVAAFAATIVVLNAVVKTAAVLQAAWNLAVAANPVVLVVIAIVALVAALVIAYKKSETFRDIVNGAMDAVMVAVRAVGDAFVWVKDKTVATFNWIKSHWKLLLAILTGPVGLAVYAIARNWDKIKAGISAVLDWIKSAWRAAWSVVVGIVRTYVGMIRSVIDGVKGAITAVVDFLQRVWGGAWSAAKTAAVNAVDAITRPFDTLLGVINSVIDAIRNIDFPSPPGWLSKIPGVGSFAAPPPESGVVARTFAPTLAATPRVRARALAGTGGAAMGGTTIVVNGALDPEAVARQIRRLLSDSDRRNGRR